MANPEGQMSAIQGRHALPPQSFSLSQDPTEAMPGHSTKDFNSKWLLGPYIQWQSGNCTSLVKEGPAHTHSYTEPMFSFFAHVFGAGDGGNCACFLAVVVISQLLPSRQELPGHINGPLCITMQSHGNDGAQKDLPALPHQT